MQMDCVYCEFPALDSEQWDYLPFCWRARQTIYSLRMLNVILWNVLGASVVHLRTSAGASANALCQARHSIHLTIAVS